MEEYKTEHKMRSGHSCIVEHNIGKEAYMLRLAGFLWREIQETCGKYSLLNAKNYAIVNNLRWPVRRKIKRKNSK